MADKGRDWPYRGWVGGSSEQPQHTSPFPTHKAPRDPGSMPLLFPVLRIISDFQGPKIADPHEIVGRCKDERGKDGRALVTSLCICPIALANLTRSGVRPLHSVAGHLRQNLITFLSLSFLVSKMGTTVTCKVLRIQAGAW